MTAPTRGLNEKRLWILLIAVALLARLIGLGDRALSHDESLHAYYSWNFSVGAGYEHNPMMHGPLLFHLNALMYRLFGASDFTSLLFPAFWGTGCVSLLYLFRRWLGAGGALAAAALVCLDPGHLFYSRYLRNDIMVSFFTLLMLWAVLDYRETRKVSSLLWLSAGLALQFITKETCYIAGVVFGSGCVFFSILETRGTGFLQWLKNLFRHPLMHCALLMLLLALPFAGALLHGPLGWDPLDNRSLAGQRRILGVAGGILLLCLLAGSLYFRSQKKTGAFWRAAALFWTVQILFYTSFFTNTVHGMASGIAGSLGYWLAQHDVQRGNPDVFFYVTLLLLYTPVLLLGAVMGVKGGIRASKVERPSVGLSEKSKAQTTCLEFHSPDLRPLTSPLFFFLWLFLGNLLIYSWAGERMPWLLLHISLPLCLLTGPALVRVFSEPGRRMLKGLLILGCFQLTANSLRVSGPLAEGPWEPLMYAHSGEQLKPSLMIIGDHLERNPGTRIWVHSKDGGASYAWPMLWYFREGEADYLDIVPGAVPENISVILVPPQKEMDFIAQGWVARLRVDMTTWPRSDYHRVTRKNLKKLYTLPAVREKLLKYYLFRGQPAWGESEWPVPNRYLLMTR